MSALEVGVPRNAAPVGPGPTFGFGTRRFSRSSDGAGPVGVATYLHHLGVLDREYLVEALWWRRSRSFGLAGHAEI
jgi:hypothetical protein